MKSSKTRLFALVALLVAIGVVIACTKKEELSNLTSTFGSSPLTTLPTTPSTTTTLPTAPTTDVTNLSVPPVTSPTTNSFASSYSKPRRHKKVKHRKGKHRRKGSKKHARRHGKRHKRLAHRR